MGAGHNRLLLYVQDDQAWVRAAGTWDPMAWHVDKAYAVAGRDAQHAFWGQVVSATAAPSGSSGSRCCTSSRSGSPEP